MKYFVDKELLTKEENYGLYHQHSAFTHVINYINQADHIISLIDSQVSMGPSRIQFDCVTNFLEKRIWDEVIINEYGILLDGELIECSLWESQQISKENIKLNITVLEQLKTILSTTKEAKIDSANQFNQNMLLKIEEAMEEGSISSFCNILGIGPGLTPFADDVVFGYLVAKNQLQMDINFNRLLVEAAKEKTTLLSAEFFRHLSENRVSEEIYKFSEDVLVKQKIIDKNIKNLLNYGHSSGWGIIFGFTKYLEREIGK